MARIQIKVGTRYVFQKQIYGVRQILANNCYRAENLSTGEEVMVAYTDILTAWSNGELRFEVAGANTVQDIEAPLKTRYADDALADLPESVQEIAWQRYHLVLALYRYYGIETIQMLPQRQIAAYISNIGRESTASVTSIYRYLRSFVDSGGDIRSLVPQTRERGGKDQSRLNEATERIIETVLEKHAAITERESTIDQVVTDVVNAVGDENRFRDPHDQLMLPSERTIRRRVEAAGTKRILGRQLSSRAKVSSRNRAWSTPHTNSRTCGDRPHDT